MKKAVVFLLGIMVGSSVTYYIEKENEKSIQHQKDLMYREMLDDNDLDEVALRVAETNPIGHRKVMIEDYVCLACTIGVPNRKLDDFRKDLAEFRELSKFVLERGKTKEDPEAVHTVSDDTKSDDGTVQDKEEIDPIIRDYIDSSMDLFLDINEKYKPDLCNLFKKLITEVRENDVDAFDDYSLKLEACAKYKTGTEKEERVREILDTFFFEFP